MRIEGLAAWARRGVALAVTALGVSACAAGSSPPGWGAAGSFTPGWDHLGRAALRAAADPFTWAPAAGAAALQIGELDDEIAEWASDETPIFGGRDAADDASDWLRAASLGLYVGAGLAAPAGGTDPVTAKARGFAAGAVALATTAAATEGLKQAVGRERPRGDADDSFPSGHTSLTAAAARLTRETLGHYGLSRGGRRATDAGLAGLALATGWARLEAGEHHPADVLAGAALGNFLAVFASEAFLRPVAGRTVTLGVRPAGGGWMLEAALAL